MKRELSTYKIYYMLRHIFRIAGSRMNTEFAYVPLAVIFLWKTHGVLICIYAICHYPICQEL